MFSLKIFQYIRYFFFVGLNWGWRIAFIIIIQEIKGEKKYGINTTGADELKRLRKKGIDISHATMYMPVSYKLLEEALAQIPGETKKHFLDIGCGKGRALCVAAHYGFQKLTGIDFSKDFCDDALKNLAVVKENIPGIDLSVVQHNAATWPIPGDVDCIFLFNPFDEVVMKKVVENIKTGIGNKPGKVNVIYANPLYKNLFLQNNFKEIYYSKKLEQFEVSILATNCKNLHQ